MVDSDDESGPQDDHGANENDAEETKAEEFEEGIPFGPDNPGPFFPEQITPRNFVTCIQEAIPMTAKRRNEDGSITTHPIYHPGLSAFCHQCFEPGVAQSSAKSANSFKVRKVGPSMYNHSRPPNEDGSVGGGMSSRKDLCERRYDGIAGNVAAEIAAEAEAQRRQREMGEAEDAEARTYTFLGLDPNNPEHRAQVESLITHIHSIQFEVSDFGISFNWFPLHDFVDMTTCNGVAGPVSTRTNQELASFRYHHGYLPCLFKDRNDVVPASNYILHCNCLWPATAESACC